LLAQVLAVVFGVDTSLQPRVSVLVGLVPLVLLLEAEQVSGEEVALGVLEGQLAVLVFLFGCVYSRVPSRLRLLLRLVVDVRRKVPDCGVIHLIWFDAAFDLRLDGPLRNGLI